jgi:signal transduction histidine kinase
MISYLIVILLTLAFLGFFLVAAIRKYYYDNLSQLLNKQALISSNFYNQYLHDMDLNENCPALLETFSQNTSAQVLIIDRNGIIIGDSSFLIEPSKIEAPDVDKALHGSPGTSTGISPETNEPIMAVSYPLITNGETVGAVRYVSSLVHVNSAIKQITIILVLVSLIILAIVILISNFLSSTITNPITKMTLAATRMAEGKFDTSADVAQKDEIGKLADTLNYMAGEVRRHDQLKNDFISSVSHEIRTPLTSIMGWAVTLRSGDLDDKIEISEGLEIIERESARLTNLVDELLDFSKFESGKITLTIRDVDLHSLISHVKKQLEPRAKRQNINLMLNVYDSIPSIRGDEDRLKQVFINILDNALKYTPDGGTITISLNIDGEFVKIVVEDTGTGIDPEDLDKVTERFYKGKESRSGSGLGLSITKQIIEMHNGIISIKSSPGNGTNIFIFLPFLAS